MVTSKYVISIFILLFKRKYQLIFLNKSYFKTKKKNQNLKIKNQNQKLKTKRKTKKQKMKI